MSTRQSVEDVNLSTCQLVNLSTCNEIPNITKCQMSWSDKFFVILSGTFSIFCHHLSSLCNFSLFLPILTLFGYFWYPLATFCNFFCNFCQALTALSNFSPCFGSLWQFFENLAIFGNCWQIYASLGRFWYIFASFCCSHKLWATFMNFLWLSPLFGNICQC